MSGTAVAWVILLVAALLEIVWAIALKEADGFSKLGPTVVGLVAAATSFALLTFALRQLPIGTAYAVWVGIGATGTAILGIILLNESASAARLASLGLIVAGIVGLKLATPA
jgi:quaternary ammonium compound-resistance protein SugE